jgi:hypothetical protein
MSIKKPVLPGYCKAPVQRLCATRSDRRACVSNKAPDSGAEADKIHPAAMSVREESWRLRFSACNGRLKGRPRRSSPGKFQTPIFDVALNRITIRGSIVGGREDLPEAIAFAADGKVKAEIHRTKLDNINQVFSDLKAGKIDGRAVLMM